MKRKKRHQHHRTHGESTEDEWPAMPASTNPSTRPPQTTTTLTPTDFSGQPQPVPPVTQQQPIGDEHPRSHSDAGTQRLNQLIGDIIQLTQPLAQSPMFLQSSKSLVKSKSKRTPQALTQAPTSTRSPLASSITGTKPKTSGKSKLTTLQASVAEREPTGRSPSSVSTSYQSSSSVSTRDQSSSSISTRDQSSSSISTRDQSSSSISTRDQSSSSISTRDQSSSSISTRDQTHPTPSDSSSSGQSTVKMPNTAILDSTQKAGNTTGTESKPLHIPGPGNLEGHVSGKEEPAEVEHDPLKYDEDGRPWELYEFYNSDKLAESIFGPEYMQTLGGMQPLAGRMESEQDDSVKDKQFKRIFDWINKKPEASNSYSVVGEKVLPGECTKPPQERSVEDSDEETEKSNKFIPFAGPLDKAFMEPGMEIKEPPELAPIELLLELEPLEDFLSEMGTMGTEKSELYIPFAGLLDPVYMKTGMEIEAPELAPSETASVSNKADKAASADKPESSNTPAPLDMAASVARYDPSPFYSETSVEESLYKHCLPLRDLTPSQRDRSTRTEKENDVSEDSTPIISDPENPTMASNVVPTPSVVEDTTDVLSELNLDNEENVAKASDVPKPPPQEYMEEDSVEVLLDEYSEVQVSFTVSTPRSVDKENVKASYSSVLCSNIQKEAKVSHAASQPHVGESFEVVSQPMPAPKKMEDSFEVVSNPMPAPTKVEDSLGVVSEASTESDEDGASSYVMVPNECLEEEQIEDEYDTI